MTANYEKEQRELLKLVADGKKKLLDAEQTKVDLRLLTKALRNYTDIRQLMPEIVNALIRRIEVHSKDKESKKVKVDIYFTAVGLFTLPTEKEIQAAMEEIRKTHSSSNLLHKAEHGVAPFQRLHRILHKNFVIRPCLNGRRFLFIL